jgi:hypothetical protein
MTDNTREIAEVANQLAQQAIAHATASGVILQGLIDALLESGSLSKVELQTVFEKAYAYISSEGAPPGQLGSPMHQMMLMILQTVAAGHGIKLGPSA